MCVVDSGMVVLLPLYYLNFGCEYGAGSGAEKGGEGEARYVLETAAAVHH